MDNLIWIKDAKYAGGYKIACTFNDGVEKVVDLQRHLSGKIFEPLKDKKYFQNFRISEWSVEWNNGADLSPEFLYTA
jgi:hypothetical protein